MSLIDRKLAKDTNVPSNDTISRQAAIDVFYQYPNINWTTLDVMKKINEVPSAQPNWCDGCKWEYAFGYGECHRCKRNFNDMYEVKDEG